MRSVMLHEARQVPSWLIFDVRQKVPAMATHLFSSAGREGLACYVAGQPPRVIRWDDIQDISAFHRTDPRSEYAVIWLRVPGDMFPLEFTARDPQWSELLEEFSKHLEGFVPFDKWFPPPLHPVFELNFNGVYAKRPNKAPEPTPGLVTPRALE